MSNKKCNCINSKLFPHRADKCALSSKKKSATKTVDEKDDGQKDTPICNSEAIPVAIVTVMNNGQEEEIIAKRIALDSVDNPITATEEASLVTSTDVDNNDEDLEDTSAAGKDIATEDEAKTMAVNANLPDGNEQCNCSMYKLKKHRKKNCRWKKHLLTAMAVTAGVVATVAIGVATAAAVEANKGHGNKSSEKSDSAAVNDDLSCSVENMRIEGERKESEQAAAARRQQEEEEEQLRAEQAARDEAQRQREADEAALEAAAVATAEALELERKRRKAAEEQAEVDRIRAAYQLEQQVLESERLRAAMIEQKRQQDLERERLRYAQQQSAPQTVFISTSSYSSSYSPSYSTSSRSTTSKPLYGTTKEGTTCKNCIKQGGRCWQHR